MNLSQEAMTSVREIALRIGVPEETVKAEMIEFCARLVLSSNNFDAKNTGEILENATGNIRATLNSATRFLAEAELVLAASRIANHQVSTLSSTLKSLGK
jgi:F0F1-type ATP synthase membrane subunit b/b'